MLALRFFMLLVLVTFSCALRKKMTILGEIQKCTNKTLEKCDNRGSCRLNCSPIVPNVFNHNVEDVKFCRAAQVLEKKCFGKNSYINAMRSNLKSLGANQCSGLENLEEVTFKHFLEQLRELTAAALRPLART